MDDPVAVCLMPRMRSGAIWILLALAAGCQRPSRAANLDKAEFESGRNRSRFLEDQDQRLKAAQDVKARAEVEHLEQKQSESSAAREQMKGLEVLGSRFYRRRGAYVPTLQISVANRTLYAITRVEFQGTLATPGRSVPWMQAPISHDIQGGLEPGEEATWYIEPDSVSPWRTAAVHEGAALTTATTRLFGMDGIVLFATTFSEEDAARLSTLRSMLAELGG